MSELSDVTNVAIDAFRRWEAAKRVEAGAQADFLALSWQVPDKDRVAFTLYNEVVRFELDRRDARAAGDQETIDACTDLINEYRKRIRTIQGKMTVQDVIRALPQCTFAGCQARYDASIVRMPGQPGTTGWRWLEDDAPGTGVHQHTIK